ncbi:MAG: carboxypeptidase regulatory-like domain-containing protein [Candidatus Cyclobacteriaceae bacterium M2_1C_046]
MKKQIIFILLALFIVTTGFNQVFKTNLKITVLNELGNPVEGADVQLYGNEDDYRKEENPVTEIVLTDKKGTVKFKELEPKAYYVMAKKDDKNNWGAGEVTDKLEEGKLNKVTIIIE